MLEIDSLQRIKELEQEVSDLKELVKVLLLEISSLKNQLSLTSKNSSKPPSSDGFYKIPKSQREKSKKKTGGQFGHEGSTLNMVYDADVIDIHKSLICEYCSFDLSSVEVSGIERRQVFDLPAICLEVTEHQSERKICCNCGNKNKGKFPSNVLAPVQYGSRVKAYCVYFNNFQFIPLDRVSQTMDTLLGIKLNESSIFNYTREIFNNLSITDSIIKNRIISSKVINLDETGFYVNGKRNWLHSYSTANLSYYSYHEKRGQEAMDEIGILPLFNGIGVHDFWKSYLSYNFTHTLCNSHHLRELKFITETEKFDWSGEIADLLMLIKDKVENELFIGHSYLSEDVLKHYSNKYLEILSQGLTNYPEKKGKQTKGKNLLDRLIKYKDSVLAFMYNFCVPFDNNQAERDIRMMKLKQKISGTFRAENGAEYFCRIRTFISTVKKQGQNILQQIYLAFESNDFVPQFLH